MCFYIRTLEIMKSIATKIAMIIMIGFLTCATCACKVGVRSKMVQFCINGEEDMESIGRMIKETARVNGMEFHEDGSEDDENARGLGIHPGYRLFSYSANKSDGMGVSVTNAGLSANEAMVGFSRGSDPEEFQGLFDSFVGSLQARWDVRDVPEERGALRTPQCESRRHANASPAQT